MRCAATDVRKRQHREEINNTESTANKAQTNRKDTNRRQISAENHCLRMQSFERKKTRPWKFVCGKTEPTHLLSWTDSFAGQRNKLRKRLDSILFSNRARDKRARSGRVPAAAPHVWRRTPRLAMMTAVDFVCRSFATAQAAPLL